MSDGFACRRGRIATQHLGATIHPTGKPSTAIFIYHHTGKTAIRTYFQSGTNFARHSQPDVDGAHLFKDVVAKEEEDGRPDKIHYFHHAVTTSISFPALAVDLLNPSHALEQKTHKLKRLVQSPNSYFMDVKCPGCVQITTVFSHAQTVVMCSSCANVLAQPTGGITRLTEGCSFRRKQA
ncbi:40S ribosomal protein S27 [Linnemannia gamsii]|uniref:40S ribosomal protein S27 n=1 Tax=Linnemannia gamsii TaxID=64522 RepID=A0ABQ7K103_9FUNG|nr:40S ribosomal protein S27 [Linnemannia gamsii]